MGLPKLSPEASKRLALQGSSFLGFAILNIALNFFNSWALKKSDSDESGNSTSTMLFSVDYHAPLRIDDDPCAKHVVSSPGPGFIFPVFYTMWHMVASVLGTCVIMSVYRPATGWPNPKQLWMYKWSVVPIAICTTANIVLNNASLTLISLFLNQVIKAAAPMPTMVFSALLEGKRYGVGMIISCGLIVGGTILAVPIGSGCSSDDVQISGVVIVIISTLAASLKPVIMSVVMQGTADRPKLAPTVVLFYDVFLSFWIMFVWWVVSWEREASISYIGEKPASAIGVIVGGACMAFGFNISSYFFIHLTSALTTTVASNGVKVINIVISALKDGVSDARNWCGVATVCVSLCVYAYFSYTAKKAPKPTLLGKDSKGAMERGLISEVTPLTGSEGGNCCVIS